MWTERRERRRASECSSVTRRVLHCILAVFAVSLAGFCLVSDLFSFFFFLVCSRIMSACFCACALVSTTATGSRSFHMFPEHLIAKA